MAIVAEDFTCEELHALEMRARYWLIVTPNENWQAAYGRLAEALNILDAHIARSSQQAVMVERAEVEA